MAATTQTDTESQVRLWIRKNKKENSRLEFKLRVDVTTAATKAEFIRDVLSLANSEGEHPRVEGYLVIGFKNGRHVDVRNEHYGVLIIKPQAARNINRWIKCCFCRCSFLSQDTVYWVA